MATDTAEPATRPARTRPDPTRNLWQVPVFLVGLAAFLAVYNGWLPLGPRDPAIGFRRDLLALQSAAEKLSPDPAELKTHLNRVAGVAESFPEAATAAHFALGTGYARLAELTADPVEAKTYWALAKNHFDAVRADQLPDPTDAPRLAYRAAKARAATFPPNTPPAELDLTRRLLLSTPTGEDPGDGHRLAAELSLRLVPPDYQHAKASLTAYIAEAGLGTPTASIARAKLKLSEVHRHLGDFEQAKRWLGQIGPDAPPDVLPTAKAQLARIRMDENDWAGAAREWEQLRSLAGVPAGLRATAAYDLGVCLLSNRPADLVGAGKLFEEAAKAEGPVGPAAAVRLADLRVRADDPARHKEAVGLLAAAVKGLDGPQDYPKTALMPIHEAQAVFESAVQVLTADGAFDAAVAVADSYRAVAIAGRDREKRAEALAAWGTALQKAGQKGAAKFAAAADEYTALAKSRPADTDKADLLRRAAGLYRLAENPAAALTSLERVVKLSGLPDEVSGPVWIDYAETLFQVNRPEDALKALQQVMLTSSSAATVARYRVGRWLIDSRLPGRVELGVALLDQIATAEKVGPAEQEMHERALVESAHEYIRKGEFAEAESRLSKQLKLYPAGGEAGLGKLLLGVSLLQQADPRAKTPVPNPVKNREEALKLFKQVVAEVDDRKAAGRETDRDPWLRTQASLRVLQAYQYLRQPANVLFEGDKLRPGFAGTADELIVLSLMYHAYKQMDKPEGMLAIHGQMREVFDKIKDKPGAFWAPNGEYSRAYWEKVWFAPDPKK